MNSRRRFLVTAPLGLMALLFLGNSSRAQEAPAPPQGVEVLARGPVHEAFAQPTDIQPEPGPVAPKEPPVPIEEVSPDQKPEGDNVQWIPGYWSWDDDQSDYIWVSGFWRVPPPGRSWLAGHWQPIDKGWQWVAGFWAASTAEEVQYLPPPPPSIDQGPPTPAPDESSTYVPGIWTYQQTRYFWRPGYWVGNRPDWVWNPAHYIWTPSGCLYNDGYWDHPLDERGLLFAPVRFGREWGNQPYTPQYTVNQDFLMGALFVRPSAQHYYFGDYFENRDATRGFVAWPDYRSGRSGYDPNYSYYRHQHAADPHWESGLRDLYRTRASGAVPRPPRTLVQQVQTINRINRNKTENINVHQNINLTNVQNVTALTALKEVHNTRVTNLGGLSQAKETKFPSRVMKLTPVPKEEHAREQKAAAQIREAAQQRRSVEGKMLSQGGVPIHHTDPPRKVKLDLPKRLPPVAAPSVQKQPLPPDQAPPHPNQKPPHPDQKPPLPPVQKAPPHPDQKPPHPDQKPPHPDQKPPHPDQKPPLPPVQKPPHPDQKPPPPVQKPPPPVQKPPHPDQKPPLPVQKPPHPDQKAPPPPVQKPPPPPVQKPPPHPVQKQPPPAQKQPPPLPVLPKHEDRPIPKFQPPRPPAPPKPPGK